MRKIITMLAVAASALGLAGGTFASAASASPRAGAASAHAAGSCIRKTSKNGPGITRYGLTVYRDSCGQQMRAAARCQGGIFPHDWWAYGSIVRGPVSPHGKATKSVADCTFNVGSWRLWGYQYKIRKNGKWIWHEIGHNNVPVATRSARSGPDSQALCISSSHQRNCMHIRHVGMRVTIHSFSDHAACMQFQNNGVFGNVSVHPPAPWNQRHVALDRKWRGKPYGRLNIVSCNPDSPGKIGAMEWANNNLYEGQTSDTGTAFVKTSKHNWVTVTGS